MEADEQIPGNQEKSPELITREELAWNPSAEQGSNLVNNATIYSSYWSFGYFPGSGVFPKPIQSPVVRSRIAIIDLCLSFNCKYSFDFSWTMTQAASCSLIGRYWSSTCLSCAGRLSRQSGGIDLLNIYTLKPREFQLSKEITTHLIYHLWVGVCLKVGKDLCWLIS